MKAIPEFWFDLISKVWMGGFILTVVVLIWYQLRLMLTKSQVKKYEYAGNNTVWFYKTASVIFSISLTFFLFDMISKLIGYVQGYEFYFIGFVCIGIGIMVGYAFVEYFKIYYPFILEKNLSKMRFKPRISPKTGKEMRLLNELEEDVHLTEEMIEHEEDYQYDYDVWLDEDTGFKLIERYDGHLKSMICPKCNFRTMKDYKETLVQSPTYKEEGLIYKEYKCSYCNHEEVKEVKIASLKQQHGVEPA